MPAGSTSCCHTGGDRENVKHHDDHRNLIVEGRLITVGRDDISDRRRITSAADARNLVVFLARGERETIAVLVNRQDRANAHYRATDKTIDEVNPLSSLQP